jgi:hypothetical protein
MDDFIITTIFGFLFFSIGYPVTRRWGLAPAPEYE